MFFLGLWWEPHLKTDGISVSFSAFRQNNANIFYLKTGFPCFFLACDGNLWKIIPISSIWKRDRSGTPPEVLLHSPLRGVTRVWASMFYWFYFKKKSAKNHKKIQWDKRFSNRRYCKHHPNVDGCKVQKVVQKTNNPTVTPSTLGWSLQYLLFENCFSCIWDLSNSWGYKWISSIWKQFGGTLWVPSWNIIFYLKSVFQYSSNIFYLKNK